MHIELAGVGGASASSGVSESAKAYLTLMSPSSHSEGEALRRPRRKAVRAVTWDDRCASLFDEMWRPARAMVSRAYGKALSDEEIKDVYSAAWTATLSALRVRGAGMSDEELRSYILTAVASHASKEMRRRSRKPAGSLDEGQEQVIADGHQLLPEEQAIGSEARGVARDLLSSLPPRRRAVMLLRYGWGLKPEEICNLVPGLSPRAYRKEITKGVAELIERLSLLESGDWCKSREPLLREYVAGTADDDVRRQVTEHLDHCRGCASFAARLSGHLHELGGLTALSVVAGALDDAESSTLERVSGAWQGMRHTASDGIDRIGSTMQALVGSGGVRGSGAAGAGIAAKLAGLGGAGKAALACVGVSAAASACVAVGVVPGVSIDDLMPGSQRTNTRVSRPHEPPNRLEDAPSNAGIGRGDLPISVVPVAPPEHTAPPADPEEHAPDPGLAEVPVEPAPVASSPAQEEFDPVASDPSVAPTSPISVPAIDPASSDGSGSTAASTAGEEFGP